MLPWDGRLLAGCSSRRSQRCFLSRHFSAYCKVYAGILPKRNVRSKQQAWRLIMLPQTEETRRISGQTPPLNDAEAGKRPRKPWLVVGIVLIAVASIFGWGVWSRVRARTALISEK